MIIESEGIKMLKLELIKEIEKVTSQIKHAKNEEVIKIQVIRLQHLSDELVLEVTGKRI